MDLSHFSGFLLFLTVFTMGFWLLIFLLTFSTSLFAQDGDPVAGKSLFNANCAACHKLDKKMNFKMYATCIIHWLLVGRILPKIKT